MLLPVEFFSLS